MLKKEQIIRYLEELNNRLIRYNSTADIGLYGGTVMCVVLNARESTQDIDAVFKPPPHTIIKIAKEIGNEFNLKEDWLNDAVKGFLSHRDKEEMLLYHQFSNLGVYAPSPYYMFAMKVLSSRTDKSTDIADIKFLLGYLKIASLEQAMSIVKNYYPVKRFPQRSLYLLEELLGG